MNSYLKIDYGSLIEHNAQILTGFNLLTKGRCDITATPNDNLPPCVIVSDFGNVKIAYDVTDGYFTEGAIGCDKRYEESLKDISILYKRDYNPNINKESLLFKGEIRPLGLNYFCYDEKIRQLYYSGARLAKKRIKEILGIELNENYKAFEIDSKDVKPSCDVLFLTRLWNPNAKEVEGEGVAEDRMAVNQMRIQIIKELRQKYGDKAICGILDDEYARQVAPELIVDKKYTNKPKYLKIMKNAKVVICSLGLHKSNGWKTGEYFAAGRPIVMEKPYYEIPFAKKNNNWLEYTTVLECLEAVDELLKDDKKRNLMEQANIEYYNQHLRPDKLIEDTCKGLLK